MRLKQKKEAEKRAKWFMTLTWARIVAEITIIIGFFIFLWFLVKGWV